MLTVTARWSRLPQATALKDDFEVGDLTIVSNDNGRPATRYRNASAAVRCGGAPDAVYACTVKKKGLFRVTLQLLTCLFLFI